MPTAAGVPYDPKADLLTRRALQVLADVLNSVISKGEVVQTGPKAWSIAGQSSQQILASELLTADPPTRPINTADSQPLLAAEVFGNNVRYGVFG